jgi:DNA-binding beta-propeller fold protein YncE
MKRTLILLLSALTVASASVSAQGPTKNYWIYVASESEDEVAVVRFGPGGTVVEKTIPVGIWPTEVEGPHGVRVSPNGEYWYMSLAHGNPFGSVYKYRTGTDELVETVEVGMFPATLDIAGSTGLLYVVNFDLHGEMKPSTISVVETRSMLEVAQVEVGIMPHSSRLNRAGDRQYSVMMMSDELVEMDAFKFQVRRRLPLSAVARARAAGMSGMDMEGHDMPGMAAGSPEGEAMGMEAAEATESMDTSMMATAKPTWAQPGPTGKFIYVACNGSNQVMEIDIEKWEIARTFKTAAGPYNLDVTSDGNLLVVSYKGDGSTGIWNLETGEEVAKVRNSRKVSHGVVISPDSRYAFVSVEGIGGEPGAVDVLDLETSKLVGSADVGKQASGLSFWKVQ